MTDVTAESPREVSPDLVASLLAYLANALGRTATSEFVAALPGSPTIEELTRHDRWCSRSEFHEITRRAVELTGDVHLGRQAGLMSYRALVGSDNAETLRSLGSVDAAIDAMADYASKMSVGRKLRVIAALPELFSCFGTAIETECQVRGDERCLYRVAWWPIATATAPAEAPDDARDGADVPLVRDISPIEQLESYHDAAAELVKARGLSDVLDRIVQQVSTAIKAPGFLLSVTTTDDDEPRVHHLGLGPEQVEQLARSLAHGELPREVVVAPIDTSASISGHLVAVLPPGNRSTWHERRTLRSYANYAASAIEIVSSLEAARKDRDTASAMFDLARALAEVNDLAGASQRLAVALPTAVHCDLATVWLYDPDAHLLRLAAAADRTGEPVDPGIQVLSPDMPSMSEVIESMIPQLVRVDQLPPSSRELMDSNQLVEAALLPIVSRGRLIGMATAGYVELLGADVRESVLERIAGMTSQASIAFENARLVEIMRHQALHDELTGLPNRSLIEDRVMHALARRERTGESVALLFLDLDNFKSVNDTMGHRAGDELLREVAARLQARLRAADTCGRFGGDEFVVVADLDGGGSCAEVAERVIGIFSDPFTLGDRSLRVTASVGVVCAPPGDVTFDELVTRSDAAMYRAKNAGRNTYAIDA
ncbi:MAG: sensor domain-containing diguanylate cyclase [Acidimicrobiia bacterium]|nr:sensor domain-containing diguanylate cyclase [Acidimicrobiia bacterium]